MASGQSKLTARPGSRSQIIHGFFNKVEHQSSDEFQSYFGYYTQELELLYTGFSSETSQANNLTAAKFEDLFYIVKILQENNGSRKDAIRSMLEARFTNSNKLNLDRSINLAIRLWLMINAQEPEFAGIRLGVTYVQWADESTLESFVRDLFPSSKYPVTAQSSRLGPYFTVAFMQNVCGLTVEWTTGLHDHLMLDRRRRVLKVFPHKGFLHALLESSKNADGRRVPIPSEVLKETVLSLDLLFPFWDNETVAFLRKEKQTFHTYGAVEATRNLSLQDFNHWRDRLLELHEEVFQSPPVSWAQLWRDRRSPQQFWTFWIALAILFLTILSTVATLVQAWASVKGLGC